MKQWSSIRPTKKKDSGSITGEAPPRLLNFFDLTAIGLGSSLAFGISVLTGHLLKNVTGPAVVVSISLAGITALVGGLCFAEVGVRFVQADSIYAYCYLWSTENAAFLFGWLLILEYVAGTASGARGVVAFLDSLLEHQISSFLERVAPLSPHDPFRYFDFLSLGIIAVVTALIAFGMKESLTVKRIFTMCNIVLLIFVITAGAFKADEKNWHPEGAPDGEFEEGFTPFGALGVAKGAAIAFYGFVGFDTVSITGNEIKKRKRNLPLAITATVLFTLLAYAGVGVILTLMLPYHKHDPHAAVPFAFQQVGWVALKWTVAVATFVGFQTSFFGVIFPLPRIIYAMANDGLLFHCLGNCQSRLRIPVAASVTGGLVAATAAALISFENLVNLTVMGALLVWTILAINVILLRYSPKLETDERLSESWPRLINFNSDITVRTLLQNCFNFSAKSPTNITERIILVNLTSFCLSSIGLGVIFNVFNGALMQKANEAVIPACILLCLLLLNVISMMCQPKSQDCAFFKVENLSGRAGVKETENFQVPLVPVLPCLSIFLNIFLVLTFESLTWIFFISWMAAGFIPYSIWRCLKCFREEIGENSLYEINKSNAVKLCESIWKMKSDKKSFYEGAINPVFSDEMDEPNKINNDSDGDANKHDRLTQIDVIEKAESVEEEKAKPAGSELQLNFVYAEDAEIDANLPEDDKVQWECVAEIHTEDEFLQDSNVLEIVDNTYDFLTELSRDDAPGSFDESKTEKCEDLTASDEDPQPEVVTSEAVVESGDESEKSAQHPVSEKSEHQNGNGHLPFKAELLNKIKEGSENTRNVSRKIITDSEIPKETTVKGSPEESPSPDGQKSGAAGKAEEKKIVRGIRNSPDPPETPEAESLPSEQNKIKQFKEKLNQLLKNQVNGSTAPGKNTQNSKPKLGLKDDTDTNLDDEKEENNLSVDIKTLNKSQIRGKLELLLTKGPPKRASLGGSFNIKMKGTNEKTELQKSEEEPNNEKAEMINGEDGEKSAKYSPDMPNERGKIISLEINKLQSDVCC